MILVSVGSFLIGLLILWLIIYSAVAAALRTHRNVLEEERASRESRAARLARAASHEDWHS